MSRQNRTIWSPEERNKVLIAAKDLAKKEKLPFTKHHQLMDLIDAAQIVLQEPRRRKFYGIDSIGEEWLNEFKAAGIAPPDWHTAHARKMSAKEGKPLTVEDRNLIRINTLADERDEAFKVRDDLLEQNKGLMAEALRLRRELQAVPTEAQVLKNFIADILWEVETRKRALPGPTSAEINKTVERVSAPPAAAREHQPPQEDRPRLPKIVLVGGQPHTHSRVQEALKDVARLSFFTADDQAFGERLRAYKDPNHGRVVLWTTIATHQQEQGLKYHNIPFTKVSVSGSDALVETLKRIAKEQANGR